MVKIMYGSIMPQRPAIASYGNGDDDTLAALLLSPGDGPLQQAQRGVVVSTGDASTCIFWCAVALGGLVRGRPIPSVRGEGYFLVG